MTNDDIAIRQLLRRFMDGTTSVEEEVRIGKWFAEHPKDVDDLEPYRKMFEWFGNGMPTDSEGNPSVAKPRTNFFLKHGKLSIAASFAIAATLAATLLFNSKQGDKPLMPQKMASVENNVSDSIKHTEIKSDTISPQAVDKIRKNHTRRGFHRHKYAPTPPMPLIAANDSMAMDGERLVDEALARLEAEQLEIIRQLELYDFDNAIIFTAILQEYGLEDGTGNTLDCCTDLETDTENSIDGNDIY